MIVYIGISKNHFTMLRYLIVKNKHQVLKNRDILTGSDLL